jgi:hypothetical protein
MMQGDKIMKYLKPFSAFLALFSLLLALSIPRMVVHAGSFGQAASPQPTSTPIPSATPVPASIQSKADIPPGYTLIEGDILVRISDLQPDIAHPNGTSLSPQSTQLWPNGVVPYEFDANVTPISQTLILKAMADWQAVAPVNFRLRSGEANYVHIQNSGGNNSQIGAQGGRQIINIYNWDMEFKMAHELGHTLGLWHEQSRPDRDTYIRINLSNVRKNDPQCPDPSGKPGSCDGQFSLHPEANYYGPHDYDFDSVMHYGECDFSVSSTCPNDPNATDGGRTIAVQPAYQSSHPLLGQRDHLSYLDKLTVAFLYPQPNWRFLDGSRPANGNGSFSSPFNDYRTAIAQTPDGGTLWIQPGIYAAVGVYGYVYGKHITIQAPLGGVILH